MKARTAKFAATAAVVLAGVGFIVFSAMAHSEPTKDADDMFAQWEKDPDSLMNKRIAVRGYVEAGSIKEDVVGQKTVRTFVVAMNDGRIRVRHEGPKPDTFRDGAEVVAKGKLVSENGQPMFIARELMAKCPSKYEGDTPKGYEGGGQKPIFEP
jgi:cytochrome c-type biogenesis protein CcmE